MVLYFIVLCIFYFSLSDFYFPLNSDGPHPYMGALSLPAGPGLDSDLLGESLQLDRPQVKFHRKMSSS